MRRPKNPPTGLEASFGVEELFFSTTDNAGVIRAGNDVFVRLSKYPVEELLGAPHNVIRHPDMPRAVFKLFWDYLLAGKTIAAYVKNLAADGSHYWVLALATPIEDGFLSIRLKPTSELFPVAETLYKELRAIETDPANQGEKNKDGMLRAEQELGEKLVALGFASYDDFMCEALRQEISARDAAMAQMPARGPRPECSDPLICKAMSAFAASQKSIDAIYAHVGALLEMREGLEQKVSFADQLSRQFRRVAMNTSVKSAALRSTSQALGTVAAHLGTSARSVRAGADSFREQADITSSVLQQSAFRLATVRLGIEMGMGYCVESAQASSQPGGLNGHASRQPLEPILIDLYTAVSRLLSAVDGALVALGPNLASMASDSEGLRRTVLQLRFAQLAGSIEAARLDVQSVVGPLLVEIGESIEHAQTELAELNRNIESLLHRVETMPDMVKQLSRHIQVLAPESLLAA
jgi:aerotaxis receptor